MVKKESTLKNMTISLLTVALLSSASLAFVYKITKEPIEKSVKQKKENAIKEVIPAFDNSPSAQMFKVDAGDGDSLVFYPGKLNDSLTGMAVETFSDKGFSGRIFIMVGFLPDGSIYNTSVLSHTETPGLGDKMEKSKSFDKNTQSWWSKQFNGKNPGIFKLKVKKDGGDVDAITAATISSRAFSDAVSKAHATYMDYLKAKAKNNE